MDLKRASKFISLVLRHKPEEIGIRLDEGGWVEIEHLLNGMDKRGYRLTHNDLFAIVEQDEKRRYSISEDQRRIRANQGHSIPVDLGLVAQKPPAVLYHGTGMKTADAIKENGILKMSRQHVHLSLDMETARKVGSRHGTAVILRVNAEQMHADGHLFYVSENGVWLTDSVPPKYLVVPIENARSEA